MKIYVVVEVSYDWHRLQENLGVSTSLHRARRLAQRLRPDLPVVIGRAASRLLDSNYDEPRHVMLESFTRQPLN